MPDDQALRNKIEQIHQRLIDAYGDRPWRPHGDAVGELINTILSQNTNDRNRDRAFARLKTRFPTWKDLLDAPIEAIEDAIRPAGLASTKAPRIQAALRHICTEQGDCSLDFLRALPVDQARTWLTSLDGVGPKTAAIVLLFALGMPAFPVDTHIYRVTKRLGLIPPQATRERAHRLLEALIPPELYYPLHLNLIAHGRQICHARRPNCPQCILRDLCDTFTLQNTEQRGAQHAP